METVRLLLFTTLWTAIWAAPLPKLSRRVELVAGLIPFAAFGLRVFGACFIGVPAADPVRMAVAPLVDWINGAASRHAVAAMGAGSVKNCCNGRIAVTCSPERPSRGDIP